MQQPLQNILFKEVQIQVLCWMCFTVLGGVVAHGNRYKPDAGTSGFREAETVLLFRDHICDRDEKLNRYDSAGETFKSYT